MKGDEAGYPGASHLTVGWVDDKPRQSLEFPIQIVDPERDCTGSPPFLSGALTECEVSVACVSPPFRLRESSSAFPLSGTRLDSKLRVPPDGFGDVGDPDQHSVYLVGH